MIIEWQLLIVAFLAATLDLFATNGGATGMSSESMEPSHLRHASRRTEDCTSVATRR
jgi:hypothetical protein